MEIKKDLIDTIMDRDPWDLLYEAKKQLRYLQRAIVKHDSYLVKSEWHDWTRSDEAGDGYFERQARNDRHRKLWEMEIAMHTKIVALEDEIYYLENGCHRGDGFEATDANEMEDI